jgi:hypothetical protein
MVDPLWCSDTKNERSQSGQLQPHRAVLDILEIVGTASGFEFASTHTILQMASFVKAAMDKLYVVRLDLPNQLSTVSKKV